MAGTAAVIFATFFGPIFAVAMTMAIDALRQKRTRQLELFRSLMGNRRARLSPEWVRALNLVEIEFYRNRAVMEAYRDLMNHINTRADVDPQGWTDRQRTLFAKLLSEIARSLRYGKMEQLDLREGGYYPQGYADFEVEQQTLRRLLIELLNGNRSLPVHSAPPTAPPNFPPPPPRPIGGRGGN
jgi:hypothetical protein